jgi:hypothetical protein
MSKANLRPVHCLAMFALNIELNAGPLAVVYWANHLQADMVLQLSFDMTPGGPL